MSIQAGKSFHTLYVMAEDIKLFFDPQRFCPVERDLIKETSGERDHRFRKIHFLSKGHTSKMTGIVYLAWQIV